VTVLALSNARISWEQEQTRKALAAETRAKEELNEAIARERGNFYKYAVGLARRDWLACDIEQARRNLEACPRELRDGDWRYLHRVCHAEVLQFKQVKSPGRLQYSPDGKTLANVGSGPLAALTLLDADTGQERFASLAISKVDSTLAFS